MSVKYIPSGYKHVTPYLTVQGAGKAMDFYQKAFGAKEVMRFEQNGIFVHGEIEIADCRIMVGEEMPQYGNKSPKTVGGTTGGLHIYVEDVDRAFDQALKAGAKQEHPVSDQFYGDRSGGLIDPFGHHWTLATHKEDLTSEQLQQRFREFMAKMSGSSENAKEKSKQHAGA